MAYPEIDDTHLLEQLGQTISADEPATPEENRLLLEQEFQRMLEEAHREAHFGDEVGDQFFGDDSPKEFDEEEDDECWDRSLLQQSEYRPYPSKTAMMLDVMDNLPRCRFSSAQMSLIIHFAKQLGAPDVPSLKGFRKMQQMLQSTCGNKPVKITSQFGNVFYMNDIRETLARDMANPLVAPHLHFYPEETDGPISETYQAERWMEYTPAQLTPMFSKGHKRFWIEELAQLKDGTFIIPHTLIVRNGHLTSDVSIAKQAPDGRWKLVDEERSVNTDEFELDYNDMIAHFGTLMRKLVADDEDLFVLMASPWADDVSGNKSKQYNKHMNMYTGNGCLPGRMLQQEFHQFSAFRDHVKSTEEEPVRCYNAATNRMCRFIIRVPGLPADNPQQSEEASHIGGNANLPCRKCQWGGTQIEKETEDIYHQCHLAGAVTDYQRTTGTKDKITQHWVELLLAKSKALKVENKRRTAADISSELRTWLDAQPGEKKNPLLDIPGLIPLRTPDRHLLAIRLQSTDLTGLTVPPVRAGYMIQYKNNLIGKHFKTLMQILAFHVHGISTPDEFGMIRAAGELGALDPLRILVKIKLHLLVHIPDDVRRFGPLVRWATEIYESHNTVFRLCSILSNRLAPSRDIALKFASMDRVKHFLSGGYWWDPILLTDPVFQRHLGWAAPPKVLPGFVKAKSAKSTPPLKWSQTKASAHWTATNLPPSPESNWRMGQVLTAQSGDKAVAGSWVFALDSTGKTIIGRIEELLAGEKKSFAMLEHFICTDQLHPDFGWPVLRRPNGAEIIAGQGHHTFRKEHQEREETNRDTMLIKHSDDDHFILNMSALHNFARLRRLTALHDDRLAFHKKMAAQASTTRTKKRTKTAEKRRATAKAKRTEAELAATAALEAEEALRRAEEGEDSDEEMQEKEGDQAAPDSDKDSGGIRRRRRRTTWSPRRSARTKGNGAEFYYQLSSTLSCLRRVSVNVDEK
ncbi:hypothetical protein B0H19DRAFT_1214025 [Mycena capillaripes]|nr:hypothetical protein B0H19DRAFT_1214025 [Mycena capillaripes]